MLGWNGKNKGLTNNPKCVIIHTESEVSAMSVWVLVDVSGYIFGVFDSEEKAYEYGNREYPGRAWDVVEREVM
jgi:hypothetical protein